jgi:SAM-dependent methyltransferase
LPPRAVAERRHRAQVDMHSLLRRRPEPTTDYTASHVGRGGDYDEGFATAPLRALMWEMEQVVLHDLLTSVEAASVLDLACGTGRITDRLVHELPDAWVTGVDVAASMLEVARRRVPGATFVELDGRELTSVVPAGSVDLATAFRFFPNADPALRRSSVEALDAVLRPGGHLLLNNHRNFWSSSYVVRRARSGRDAPGATNRSIVGPFLDRGFSVVGRRSLGVLPQSDERSYVCPLPTAVRLERANQRTLAARHTAGTNTVWLLRKRPAAG